MHCLQGLFSKLRGLIVKTGSGHDGGSQPGMAFDRVYRITGVKLDGYTDVTFGLGANVADA